MKIINFDQGQKITDKKISSGGTIGFRAPEVIDGSCKDLAAADIYSAGVILYALKARTMPFAENTIKDINGNESTTSEYYTSFMRENDILGRNGYTKE